MSPYIVNNIITMEYTNCEVCHDCGYLDYNVYCSCAAGVFYETTDELNLQMFTGDLDIGLDDSIEIDYDSEEYANACTMLYLLDNLPFHDEMKIIDDFNDDDISDDFYPESNNDDYDYQNDTPWISSYEWDLHNDGQCNFPCDACAYEDSTW